VSFHVERGLSSLLIYPPLWLIVDIIALLASRGHPFSQVEETHDLRLLFSRTTHVFEVVVLYYASCGGYCTSDSIFVVNCQQGA